MMDRDKVFLGTSGWVYKEWEGPFYQKSEKRKLRAYCRVFNSVEIDSTWYRNPLKGTVMGWLRYSPSNFIYTAKMPKLITHDKRLGLKGDIQADLNTFFELMRPIQLGGKLGCLLIQLPPSYGYNPENLESFFQMLDPQFRFAVEFRNLSWIREETWQLLIKHKIAYASVDEPLLPPDVHLTTDFAYFRWHGRGKDPWFDYLYSKQELDQWIPKIEKATENAKKIYGYFNNHFHGYAPENCLYLIEKLGLQTEQQKKIKQRTSLKQTDINSFLNNK
jgi:uncharacterized protein YecE (DUF72 family)